MARRGRPPVPRTWAWPALSAALRHGPLRNAELAEEVYGARDFHAVQAMRQLLFRLVRRGYVVRVGWGWVALPDRRDEMRRVTIRWLIGQLEQGPATVRELALALDTKPGTVGQWLYRLRQRGELRSAVAPPEKWVRRRGRWPGTRPYPVRVYWLERTGRRAA